jgi:hypothetical protein
VTEIPEHFDLEHFRTRIFDFAPGNHVAAFGPTGQAGKSTMLLQLLDSVATGEQPATVLVMKHRDRVVAHWTRELGFRETPSWPPVAKLKDMKVLGGHKPRGYTLWPKQTLSDVRGDNLKLQREFGRAIVHNRKHVPSITFADEIYGLMAELGADEKTPTGFVPGLRPLLTSVVTRDSIAGHSLWFASQKPSGTQGISLPGFLFSSAEHMFLSRDGEQRNRVRYGEIACGINPAEIERETLRLDPFSWLYIKRSGHGTGGPEWAVVNAYDEALRV